MRNEDDLFLVVCYCEGVWILVLRAFLSEVLVFLRFCYVDLDTLVFYTFLKACLSSMKPHLLSLYLVLLIVVTNESQQTKQVHETI